MRGWRDDEIVTLDRDAYPLTQSSRLITWLKATVRDWDLTLSTAFGGERWARSVRERRFTARE
jgi:hypothetical protein